MPILSMEDITKMSPLLQKNGLYPFVKKMQIQDEVFYTVQLAAFADAVTMNNFICMYVNNRKMKRLQRKMNKRLKRR